MLWLTAESDGFKPRWLQYHITRWRELSADKNPREMGSDRIHIVTVHEDGSEIFYLTVHTDDESTLA